ncbi:alanine racemase [Dongia sp.]|uniref:alanine racemase n=1 Tax=Dongia sp. TaxID=1977262 RepID=UPI0035B3EFBD
MPSRDTSMDGFDQAAIDAALAKVGVGKIDGITKGFPAHLPATTLAGIGGLGLNLLRGDTPYPVAVLLRSALDHNGQWMRQFLTHTGAYLMPHGKTTMSPQLFALQAGNGCWGLTVATIQQAMVAAESGCRRILMANQMVSRADVAGAAALLRRCPDLVFWSYVDSAEGVRRLHDFAGAAGLGGKLRVLLEVGMMGGRTGCRRMDQVSATLDALAQCAASLSLEGVACFEGLVHSEDAQADERKVGAFLDFVIEAARAADSRSAFGSEEVLLTAGGSAYFDMVARRFAEIRLTKKTRVVIRSGCYLTHDSHYYDDIFDRIEGRIPEAWRRMGRLRPALFVWSMVQSRPEPGLAILTMGKRDASFDIDLPRPVWRYRPGVDKEPTAALSGWSVKGMNDQHAYLAMGADDELRVGDLIACGISHPCTTFDRWRMIYLADDDWSVTGAVTTQF